MEDIGEVFGLYACGELDFEKISSVVECDYEEGGGSGDGGGFGV